MRPFFRHFFLATLMFALAGICPTAASTEYVPFGAEWRYLDDGSDQDVAWRAFDFDDSGWAIGPAEFGYGEDDEATQVSFGPDTRNKYPTTYFRTEFIVADPLLVPQLLVELLRDDGAVIFLNGAEVGRSNMPTGPVLFDTFALSSLAGSNEREIVPLIIGTELLRAGSNVLAVEIHQGNGTNSDLSFDLRVSDGNTPFTPQLVARQLMLPAGDTSLTLGSMNLNAVDCDSADTSLTFSISSRFACRLESIGTPGIALSEFTQQQIADGEIRFVRETPGTFAPPKTVGGGADFSEREEISGLVASIQNPDLLWAIEDSDNPASLLAIGIDGSNRGDWSLTGATNIDYEDIAAATVDGVPYLYVGDFGDNDAARTDLAIYRVVEPLVGTTAGGTVNPADILKIDIQYPESPAGESGVGSAGVPARRDVEAMIVDPANGDIYLFSKRETRARIFRLAHQAQYTGVQTLEYLGEMPAIVTDSVFGIDFTTTGADISRDGLQVVVRNYSHTFLYQRTDLSTPLVDLLTSTSAEELPADDLGIVQWEAICFSANGTELFTVGENESGSQSVQLLNYTRPTAEVLPAFSVSVSDGLLSDGPHPMIISNEPSAALLQWRAEQFTATELADAQLEASLWGDTADPDGDGLPNLAEYALDRSARNPDADGGINVSIDGGEITARFERRIDRPDVTLRVETSTNLVGWNPIPDTAEGTAGNFEQRSATIPVSGAQRQWIRLAAQR